MDGKHVFKLLLIPLTALALIPFVASAPPCGGYDGSTDYDYSYQSAYVRVNLTYQSFWGEDCTTSPYINFAKQGMWCHGEGDEFELYAQYFPAGSTSGWDDPDVTVDDSCGSSGCSDYDQTWSGEDERIITARDTSGQVPDSYYVCWGKDYSGGYWVWAWTGIGWWGGWQNNVDKEPDPPNNPDPQDGESDVSLSPTLSVDINDVENNAMRVKFYDASDNSLIGEVRNQHNNDRPSVTWSGLQPTTTYSWYAVAEEENTPAKSQKSSTWSFTTTDSIVRSQSNNAAPRGSIWIEGNNFHWADGSTEYWLEDAELVTSNPGGPSGALWVEGNYLHWIDQNGNERRYQGPVHDSSPGGSSGSVWLESSDIHYIDASGDERITQ